MNMEKQSWTVVKFLNDNSVAAVPTKWINENKCLWPPFTSVKLTTAIKSQGMDTCWPSYEVEIFRNATYDNYEMARSKARKAEDTSDLNTDTDITTGRRKFKKKTFSSSESSEEELNVSQKFPEPPKMSVKLPKHVTLESNEKKETMECSSSYKNLAAQEETSSSESSVTFLPENIPLLTEHPSDLTKAKTKSTNTNIMKKLTSSSDNQVIHSPCTCCPQHGDVYKEILRQLFYLRSVTREMLDDIKTIKDGSKNDGNMEGNIQSESIFKLFQLPLKTVEELAKFNEYLNDQNNYLSVELEMTKFGGNNNYEFVRRCLSSLMANELAVKYSWLGRREKDSFYGFAIANLIITAAEKAKKSSERKETEESIKNWLKRANDRIKKGK